MHLRYLAHVVLLPVLLAGVVLAVNWRWYSGPLVEVGDEAAYALQVERAKQLEELVGPYSRFDFNHPGPIASYYYAFTEPMLAGLPSPMGRHHVAQLLLNAAFLAMALHAICVLSPRKADSLLLVAALLFVLARSSLDPDFLSKLWPPYLLVFPTVTLLTTMAGVSLGRIGLVLPAMLASIYMVHNHVSAIIVVVPMWVVGLGSGLASRWQTGAQHTRVERMALWTSLAILTVTSAPLVIDEWRHDPGNLARLRAFFAAQPGPSHGWSEALGFVAGFFARPVSRESAHPERLMATLMLASTLAVFGAPIHRRILALLWLAVALLVVGATRVVGPLIDHVMLFALALVAIGGFLALVGLRLNRPIIGWPLLLASALVAVDAGRVRGEVTSPATSEVLLEAIAPRPGDAYELAWEDEGPHHEQWAMAASLALVMTRRGIAVCTPPAWWVMFGRDMSSCPQDAKRLALYATARRPRPVRSRATSAGGTTVEFGPMLPLALPVTLDTSAAFDYFRGWRGSGQGPRAPEGSRATVIVPLSEAGSGDSTTHALISVNGFVGPGVRVNVEINGQTLGNLVAEGKVQQTWRVPARVLVAGENLVVFTREPDSLGGAATGGPHFLLDSVTIGIETLK